MTETRDIVDSAGNVVGQLTLPIDTPEEEWKRLLAPYLEVQLIQYSYGKKVDARELTTLIAQVSVDQNSPLYDLMDHVEASEDMANLYFKKVLAEDLKALLDQIVSDYIYTPPSPISLPEYETNEAATLAGIGVGEFYRTGEFVKVVF